MQAIQSAISQYLKDNAPCVFESVISEFTSVTDEQEAIEYPYSHRLFDVIVDEVGYRICRHVGDVISFSISKTDVPSSRFGVIYELEGEGLRRWCKDVEAWEADEDCSFEDGKPDPKNYL